MIPSPRPARASWPCPAPGRGGKVSSLNVALPPSAGFILSFFTSHRTLIRRLVFPLQPCVPPPGCRLNRRERSRAMVLRFWRWWCDNKFGTTRAKRRVYNDPGRSFRPRLEPLEDRCLPAPLVGSLVGDLPGTVPGAAGHVGLIRPGSAAAIQVDVTVP